MAHNGIIIVFDEEYDSGSREIPSKPVTSSNKAFTFLAEHKSDNEETPLKNNSSGNLHIETTNFIKNQVVTYQVWVIG